MEQQEKTIDTLQQPSPLPAPNASTSDVAPLRTSLSTLLTGQVLQDGETVLLILKPSRWFILTTSLRHLAIIALLGIFGWSVWPEGLGGPEAWWQLGALAAVARLGWGLAQWMGQIYILTDLRVASIAGVLQSEVFACPLRRVRSTRLLGSAHERVLARGTIEIAPADESALPGYWQMIRNPREVHEMLDRTIARAKQNGCGS